jgi:hypothetical protein
MKQQNNNQLEYIMMFNDGVVYRAHTLDNAPGNSAPLKELAFHLIVFHEEFDGHKMIASYREGAYATSYIRKILDASTSPEKVSDTCLEVLADIMIQDVAKDWYADKKIVPGERRNESIADYFNKNIDTGVDTYDLKIKNLAPINKK